MENIKKMLEELKDYCEKNNYHCECAVVKDEDTAPLYCVAGMPLELITLLTTLLKIICKSNGIPLEAIAYYILLNGSFEIVNTDGENEK